MKTMCGEPSTCSPSRAQQEEAAERYDEGMISRQERAQICERLLRDAAILRAVGDRALAQGDHETTSAVAGVVGDLLSLAGLLLDRRSSRKSG